ncbi:hypothetical protein TUBRATIS_001470 [Tubulinosema ratisbonensis]|uniref:RNA polymerase III subunit C3 n=1 Tax=Tubulinosema ratisbonensis TaxID=291195 RepID=A0A437AQD4_9MICR|nr:hypothetical protein TUBRATIS_001470 [Tubulinosema ratisbonensis]
MSEEIKKFTNLFSAYGTYPQKILKILYLNTERSFTQLLIASQLTKLDLTLTLSLLLQTRHIKFRTRNNKVTYFLSDCKIIYFPFFCDYIYKNLKGAYNLFVKILVNGIVNSKRIKSLEELDLLVLNKFVKLIDSSQVKLMYKEEENKIEIKKQKEEIKNYCFVDYEEIKRKILYDYCTLLIIKRYNLVAGKVFRLVISNKSVNLGEIIKNINHSHKLNENEVDICLEYLESDKIIFRNKFDTFSIQSHWLEIFKEICKNNYLTNNFDFNTQRIFNILLKKEICDINTSKTVLLSNANLRKSLLNLQLIGFISIVGDINANTFYNKSNLKWKSNKEFSDLFYKNWLFKEIIFKKENYEQKIIEFLIFSF